LDLLVGLTILCNKYDCTLTVRPWTLLWLTTLLPRANEPGFEKLLLATTEFGLTHHFYKLTEALVKVRSASINTAAALAGYDLLDASLLGQYFVPYVVMFHTY
jgi:hypothetical protein